MRTPHLRAGGRLTWNLTCWVVGPGLGHAGPRRVEGWRGPGVEGCRGGPRAADPPPGRACSAPPSRTPTSLCGSSNPHPNNRSFGELLWRPTGLPTNVPNLTSMNSNMQVTLHMPFESAVPTTSEFILQMGSHFCEMSPQKDNHCASLTSAKMGNSKCPATNPVKYMGT